MDWGRAKLGEIAEVGAGNSAPQDKELFLDGSFPFFRTSDIGRVLFGRVFEARDLLNKAGIKKLKKYSVDDILIPKSGASTFLNHRVMLGVDGYVSSHLAVVSANKKVILPKYLLYFLSLIKAQDLIQDHSYPSLKLTDITSIDVSYPPIPEQQRIVAILDQAFADIEKARANAEKNLKNILELYLSNKQEIFGRSNLESQMMNLTSVCENIFAGGDAPKKGLYSKTKTDNYKIPIYANAVKDAGLYGFTDYFRVDKPSITIAARGSGTGHIELRRDSFLPIVRLIVLIPLTETLSLEYFKHALQNLDILRSGSAIPQLTVPMIKEYSIPVPSLDSQLSIVDEIESLGGYIEECKKLYEQKLASLDELKKSLLQKAFSGELTKSKGIAA
tara:strand:- start:249 stop:1415 length:1167 start_codon:yes stop_codon:yes gene_type:complete